jgi:GGDEF domain-containing protein
MLFRCLTSLNSFNDFIKYLNENRSKCYLGMLDVDKLSDFNYLNGYELGDFQLEKLCKLLLDILPTGSLLTRLGSDEFIFVLNEKYF